MMQRNKTIGAKFIISVWTISIIVVIYLSLIPRVEFLVEFWGADKVYHLIAYGWLGFLPTIGFEKRSTGIIAALSIILLGIGLEWAQKFVVGRMFSFTDMIANTLGVVLGIISGRLLLSRFKAAVPR